MSGLNARTLLVGVTAVGVLWLAAPAAADSPPPLPQSYRKVTPGGRFVFVMIAPQPVEVETRYEREEAAAEIRYIRETYARSGMYRNNGSAEPLWTVDWYAHVVEPAADGRHVVRRGPWGWLREDRTPDLDCEAVSFFADGQLLRTYQVSELVRDPGRLPRSVSYYHWRERWERSLSGEYEYTLTTTDGSRFVFDLRTGEIVSRSRVGPPAWVWEVVVGGVAAVTTVGWAAWRWSRRRRAPAEQVAPPPPAGG